MVQWHCFKGLLLFMIIIYCSALLSQSTEITKQITKDNCKNNRTFHAECFFNISFQPPLTEKLECFLTFPTKTIYSGLLLGESLVLKKQVGNMCPEFRLRIFSPVEESRYIYSICGRGMYNFFTPLNHFNLTYIQYNNDGLIDNSTIIKMQLRLETGKPCDDLNSKTFDVKNHLSWIIILSVIGGVVLIIVCVVIVYRYRLKGNKRKALNPSSPEADIPLCDSEKGGNDKGRDLEDDRNGQDSSINVASKVSQNQ